MSSTDYSLADLLNLHEARERDKAEGRGKQRRTCLRCDTPFTSDGPHHRICGGCVFREHQRVEHDVHPGVVTSGCRRTRARRGGS